jgi:MerR family transcriptional regulator, copper efflux regulator
MLINTVARLAGMSKDGIRHYEELGLISSCPKQAGSRTYRDYGPEVLETIDKIRQAQRLGFTLKEIVPLLNAYASATLSADETAEFLEQRLLVIRGKISELRQVEDFISIKLEHYRRV